MRIEVGWGARLRQERERLGLAQEALVNRNTQRAYETEANAPTIRYLESLEERGFDLAFILAGKGDTEEMVTDANAPNARTLNYEQLELIDCFDRLSRADQSALLQIARSMAGQTSPPGQRVHALPVGFKPEGK